MTNISEREPIIGIRTAETSSSRENYENIDEIRSPELHQSEHQSYPAIVTPDEELSRFSTRLQCQNCDEIVFTEVKYKIGQGTFFYACGVILVSFMIITIIASVVVSSIFEPVMVVTFFKIWFILFVGICCSICIAASGAIPFCFKQFYDAQHICPQCQLVIGTREIAHVFNI